jgi:hypothetical protein
MSRDYSRSTFDPWRDFGAVLMQQGRVQLDADWNEHGAILERRQRVGTMDTLGRAVVPRETEDGFKITASGGALTIGRGRIYVDGILAENHAPGPTALDSHLAEIVGTSAVDYAGQPYYPNPPVLPTSPGPHLAYLDVWQREVTAIESPDLVETALGVDTTTRWQTAWQVKVLENIDPSITCDTKLEDIPAWAAKHPPAAGRLTVDTLPVEESKPCVIPPSSGYTGLENQLYRVEIHQEATPGTPATFKWSRDNASVATRVTEINATRDRLVVESLGRDEVLRFKDGDWIEVTDDWRELHNLPGDLRRIKPGGGVDKATRSIVLDAALTAGSFPTDGEDHTTSWRNTRIRRWDQKGQVLDGDGKPYCNLDDPGSGGAIPVPSGGSVLVHLESGILVSFTLDPALSGGRFRSGDYWLFAARGSDGSVEQLVAEPPVGIHHHYAKLARVTFPDEATSCRTIWPPQNGGCCLRVLPGDDLQQAIDSVISQGGGCVCLCRGVHEITGPLRISDASALRVQGEGLATVVRLRGTDENGLGGIVLSRSRNVLLERFAIIGEDVPAAVWTLSLQAGSASANESLSLRDLTVINSSPASEGVAPAAVRLGQAADISLERCRLVGEIGVAAVFSDVLPYPIETLKTTAKYGPGVGRLRMAQVAVRYGSHGVWALGADAWELEGCDLRPSAARDMTNLRGFLDREPASGPALPPLLPGHSTRPQGPFTRRQTTAQFLRELSALIKTLYETSSDLDHGTAISAFRWRDCHVRDCELLGARGMAIFWWLRGNLADSRINAGQEGVRVFWLHDARLSGNRSTCAEAALAVLGSYRAVIDGNHIRARAGLTNATWAQELERLLGYVLEVAVVYSPVTPEDSSVPRAARAFWMLLRESLKLMTLGDLVAAALKVFAPEPANQPLAYFMLAAWFYQSLRDDTPEIEWPSLLLAISVLGNDIEAETSCVALDPVLALGGLTVAQNRLHTTTGQSLRIQARPGLGSVQLLNLLWRYVMRSLTDDVLPDMINGAQNDPTMRPWVPVLQLLLEKLGSWRTGSESFLEADLRIESNQLRSLATAVESNLWELTIRDNHITLQEQPLTQAEGGLVVGALLRSEGTAALAYAIRDGAREPVRRGVSMLGSDALLSSASRRAAGAEAVFEIASNVGQPKLRTAANNLAVAINAADQVAVTEALVEFEETLAPYVNSFGIVAGNPGCRVERNHVIVAPDADPATSSRGGILVTADQSMLAALLVELVGAGGESLAAAGITETLIADNEVIGGYGHGIHVYAPVVVGQAQLGLFNLKIHHNQVRGMAGAGLRIEEESLAVGVDVVDNEIVDCSNQVAAVGLTNDKGGISIENAALCRVRGNRVVRCGRGLMKGQVFGVDIEGVYGLELQDNELLHNGADRASIDTGGARLTDIYGHAVIRDNQILFHQGFGLLWSNSTEAGAEPALPAELLTSIAFYLQWRKADGLIDPNALTQDAGRVSAIVSGNVWKVKGAAEVQAFSLLNISELTFTGNSGVSHATTTSIGKISQVERCVFSHNSFTCGAAETVMLCKIFSGVVAGNATTKPIGLYNSSSGLGVMDGLNQPSLSRH